MKTYAIGWALLATGDSRIPFFNELTGWRRAYSDENAVIFIGE